MMRAWTRPCQCPPLAEPTEQEASRLLEVNESIGYVEKATNA